MGHRNDLAESWVMVMTMETDDAGTVSMNDLKSCRVSGEKEAIAVARQRW